MNKQPSNKEILIEYLLKEYEKSTSNEVLIYKSDLPDIPLAPGNIIKTIYLLKEDGLLTIVRDQLMMISVFLDSRIEISLH